MPPKYIPFSDVDWNYHNSGPEKMLRANNIIRVRNAIENNLMGIGLKGVIAVIINSTRERNRIFGTEVGEDEDEQTEQIKEYRNSVSKEVFVEYLKEQKLNKHYNEDGNPSS
uniref:Uncharacterized protein n=1 Tax=Rhizophagus irregularis (strain DAOM 181602 / DAOM 197198 / MUCL 43194) TaxID=747089 RepID=U9SSP5_RHIID